MGEKIRLPLEVGLSAIIKHIRAIKKTAEQSGSAVSALAQATAESVEEIEEILNKKQDAIISVPCIISKEGWLPAETDECGYPYRYDLAIDGITANARADVTIAPNSVETALTCGLCPTTETLDGKIRLWSVNKPSEPIAAEYWIYSGRE